MPFTLPFAVPCLSPLLPRARDWELKQTFAGESAGKTKKNQNESLCLRTAIGVKMTDVSPDQRKIELLINGNCAENKLSYVAKQALSENQVIHCFKIRNSVLLRWQAFIHSPTKKYIDLLNDPIPDGVVKVKRNSE